MSDEKQQLYDCEYRLRDVRDFITASAPGPNGTEVRTATPAHGSLRRFVGWDEAADPANASTVALLKEMRDRIPCNPLDPPLEPGFIPAAWQIVRRLEAIMRLYGEINSVLVETTEEEFPRSYREGMQNVIFDVMYATDLFWQSLAGEPPKLTLAGKFLKAVLAGYDPGRLSFGPGGARDSVST